MREELTRTSTRAYIPPYDLAIVDVGLGNKDEAFVQLNHAIDDRELECVYFKVMPELDSLRSDPRFAKLLQRVGLPQ